MDNVLVNEAYLTDIANAIRTKLNVITKYKPSEMPFAIGAIASKSGNHYTDLFTTYRTEPKSLTAGDQNESEILRASAFRHISSNLADAYLLTLESITFPETGIDSEIIAPSSMYYFFSKCLAKEINLNGLNAVNITNMQYLCENCTNLEVFNFGYTNLNKVTTLYGAFSNCISLISVVAPISLNTAALTNVNYMFKKCTALKSIDLSFLDFTKVTSQSGMFSDCSELISVTLPITVTDLRSGSSSASSSAMFYNCPKLKSLVLKSNIVMEY